MIAQTLLVREMLAIFQGNELSIGIIFSHWMLGVACGSYAGGRVEPGNSRQTRMALAAAFAGTGIFLLAAFLLLINFRQILHVFPGEGISLWTTLWSSFVLLFPLSSCVGAQFSLSVRTLENYRGRSPSGKIYFLESAGYLLGGVIFTYLFLPWLDTWTVVVIQSLLCLFFAFLAADSRLSVQRGALSLAVCVVLFLSVNGPVKSFTLAHIFPGYRVLEIKNSPYAQLVAVERDNEVHILSDSVPALTLPHADIEKEEEFGILPLLYVKEPKKVLLIGGGGKYVPAIMKFPVARLDYVELDPWFMRLAEKYGPGKDPRVKLHYTDGGLFLKKATETYDVILLGVPYPVTLAMNRFYTVECFALLKRRLSNYGILALSLPGSSVYLDDNVARLTAVTVKTLSCVFSEVKMIPGDDSTLIIAGAAPLASEAAIKGRFLTQALSTVFLSPPYLDYRFDAERERRFAERVNKDVAVVSRNRDFAPAGLVAGLRYWQSIFAPRGAGIYELFMHYSWLLWIAALMWFVSGKAGYGGTAFISGTAAMSLQMISMWGLQIAKGSIYHWAGLLTAAFMAGSAAGSWITRQRYLQPASNARLLLIELLFFLWIAAGWVFIKIAEIAWPAFFVFSFGSGILLGLEFPLITLLNMRSTARSETVAAGNMYAADLLGGWLAAFGVGSVLIPLWGINKTILLILVLKAISLVWCIRYANGRPG